MKRHNPYEDPYQEVDAPPRGTGPGSGGQSGDTQGLSDLAEASSESVEELVEDGQFLDSELIDGVENAPDADQGPVRLRRRPEDIPPGPDRL